MSKPKNRLIEIARLERLVKGMERLFDRADHKLQELVDRDRTMIEMNSRIGELARERNELHVKLAKLTKLPKLRRRR